MEFDIDKWLNLVIEKLKEDFKENLLFIGLQGSYNRGEATPESDIDLVVILDNMTFENLKTYRLIIESMPQKNKACGFISGKNEIQKWSKTDLFQFFYDTRSLFGNLEDIIQPPDITDIKKSIKTSCESLYHSAIHSFVHSDDYVNDMQNLSKMAFFILQAKHFIETNNYISTKKQLFECLDGIDKEILGICINIDTIEIENFYNKLITWCSTNI
ncbi:MAG: nucleotidyltransferase domain-containing protein [Cyanobacteria bacterium RUI128]|nr:nucleotidyltransferase domain-containing protein [Cyanobacteria bacterium RUI128]